ncbi:MAG: GTP pyrophosphokinase family protein [Eubacteriaceae bacterium]|nr:GTP pyrophosphokinase family protein [Eubacteriaceae bacterium]
MTTESIYGHCKETLSLVENIMLDRLTRLNKETKAKTGEGIYEHLNSRVKTEESMREKCARKGLPETPESALTKIHDAVGFRVITTFIDDIYTNVDYLKSFDDITVIEEKDYIRHAKPNGYRSYHMILALTLPYEDILGNNPGTFYVEIQLRTIAMDTWASLEHQMKYKHDIGSANQKLITVELKRCADELASCDVSMQTIRDLIRDSR